MGYEYSPVKLADGVYSVGVIDWNLRDFHGYETPKGGTYNSYLIVDDKIALIDTVKSQFSEGLINSIRQIVDPSKIDYVISNHVEMDHSSSLSEIMKLAPGAKIYASKRGKTGLFEYYKEEGCENWDIEVVSTGDELNLGNKTLMFIEAVMLHWPDSMHTYLKEDKILFSNDAFGQHIATSQRFDYDVGDVIDDAAEYYANILMPFGSQVLKYFDKAEELGLEFNMIAPSHGIIWKEHIDDILRAYKSWASGETVPKVPVIYDTMWGSTEMMAKEVLEGIRSAGVETELLHLRKNNLSLIIKEILDAPVIALGSTTINNGMFHSVAGFLTHLKGLKPKGKKAVVFGSYGWGGGGVQRAEDELDKGGFELLDKGLKVKFRPDEEDLKFCRELGVRLAEVAKHE
ncbi:MAG: FprA family A-type flavoprotein [Methanohalobium sp.]|uniref:FprA family A-type flavoprotein n=1 Tax=Methanohalobium sp. TaxID=2837493 RepID=UPI00397AF827